MMNNKMNDGGWLLKNVCEIITDSNYICIIHTSEKQNKNMFLPCVK